jgi:hypothetical protein
VAIGRQLGVSRKSVADVLANGRGDTERGSAGSDPSAGMVRQPGPGPPVRVVATHQTASGGSLNLTAYLVSVWYEPSS